MQRIYPKEKIVYEPLTSDGKVLTNPEKKKKIVIGDKYKYKKNIFIEVWQFFFYYFLAKPLFLIYGKIFLGIKVYNKQNLKGIKGGAITVSNHVHYLDFSIATNFIGGFKRSHIISNKENFNVPFAGKLAAAYGVMPLPDTIKSQINFYKQVNTYLKQGRYIHLFPEASMWPYYNKLRPFKQGAFHFASQNNLPIIPYVLTFRESKGLERIIRKRPRINVYICKLIYPNKTLSLKQQNADLQEKTKQEMEMVLAEHKSFEFWQYIKDDELNKKDSI